VIVHGPKGPQPKNGADYSDFTQDQLDPKALNCVGWHLVQALCAFDGGRPGACRNGVCVDVTATMVACQGPGHLCEDGAPACCPDSKAGKQCGHSPNGVSICCNADATTCKQSYECCSGNCNITDVMNHTGVCTALPVGATCTDSSQCQSPSECDADGAPVSSGARGACCQPAASGMLDCDRDEDCCTSKCLPTGGDEFKCRCSRQSETCRTNGDCCASASKCTNGTCQPDIVICKPDFDACQSDQECCNGLCDAGPHLCVCRPPGDLCSRDAQCCSGNCEGDQCQACQAPTITCGNGCCPANTRCCGAGPTGIPSCQSDCVH